MSKFLVEHKYLEIISTKLKYSYRFKTTIKFLPIKNEILLYHLTYFIITLIVVITII